MAVLRLSRQARDHHPSSGGAGVSPDLGSTAAPLTGRPMNADGSCPRCQGLRLLAEMPGPEWRLPLQRRNELCLVRAYETYVETVVLEDDGLVAINRRPIVGRSSRTIAIEDFAGSLTEATTLLRQPPRWDTEREGPSNYQVGWPATEYQDQPLGGPS